MKWKRSYQYCSTFLKIRQWNFIYHIKFALEGGSVRCVKKAGVLTPALRFVFTIWSARRLHSANSCPFEWASFRCNNRVWLWLSNRWKKQSKCSPNRLPCLYNIHSSSYCNFWTPNYQSRLRCREWWCLLSCRSYRTHIHQSRLRCQEWWCLLN